MFSNYFELADGTNLFYKVYGSTLGTEINKEQPTLIFLHGGPGVVDHTLYEEFWSRFSNREIISPAFQVVFLDHRGSGRSYVGDKNYGSPGTWNLEQWGKDVYNLFSGLGIHKPIIAGVSFGGVVAISCATKYPDELGGLILSDTDAKFDLDEVIAAFEARVKEDGKPEAEVALVCGTARMMFQDTTPETYNNYIKFCIPYCSTAHYTPEDINRCVKNEAVAFHYNRNELTTFNFLPLLHRISCPTLVMSGDQSPVHTEASARRTATALPAELLTLIVFEDTGSPVYANNKQRATEAVSYLLAKAIEYKTKENHEKTSVPGTRP